MNLKRLLAGILATSLLSATMVAFAEEDTAIIPTEDVVTELQASYDKMYMTGTATIKEDGLYILDTAEIAETILNTDENTIFVDANGYKSSLEGLKDGTAIKAVTSLAMTMSIPPQTYAYVVMEANEKGEFPFYIEVAATRVDEHGNTIISSADGNYEIVYSAESTVLEPFATRNIVTIEDIKEGTRLLVTSSIMTMSIPAVVPAEKIAVLPELVIAPSVEEETPVIPEKVILNGNEIATSELAAQVIDRDGIYFLPVRAICEAAGLEVAWDGTLKAITVGTTAMGVTFNIGENAYGKAKMMRQPLSAAPILENDRTYVPVDFFTEILEATAEIADGAINITLAK